MIECIPYAVSKQCNNCGIEKRFEEFHFHYKARYGVSAYCAVCSKMKYDVQKLRHKRELDYEKYIEGTRLDFLNELSAAYRLKMIYYLQSTLIYSCNKLC